MIEINLIPDVKQELIKAQAIRSKVIVWSISISIISLAILTLLAIFVFGVQTLRNSVADDKIQEESSKLASVEDLSKTLTIQNQLTVLSDLNDNKNISSRIFSVIGAITPTGENEVKISNLTVNSNDKKITIDGQSKNSYTALEIFKKTIEGADIEYTDSKGDKKSVAMASKISISDTSYGEDNTGQKVLRFTISFEYAKELFSSELNNFAIVITVDGNVTDSYLGVPRSIFTDRATDITEGQ